MICVLSISHAVVFLYIKMIDKVWMQSVLYASFFGVLVGCYMHFIYKIPIKRTWLIAIAIFLVSFFS